MNRLLLSLAPSDLRVLAGAIRMGRLTQPYSAPAIQQILSGDHAESIASSLQETAALGLPAAGMAQSLELLAEAMTQRPRIDDLVELVATGPSMSGIANRDTGVVVSDLFRRAQQSVAIVGYAVYQGQKVFQALAARMTDRPGLKVRMYLDIQRKAGDTTAQSALVQRFCHNFRTKQWPGGVCMPEIFYDPRSSALDRSNAASLHAKCVVVDRRDVFVSSANFTEAGQARNIELGLLLSSESIAGRILSFFDQLIENGHLMRAV